MAQPLVLLQQHNPAFFVQLVQRAAALEEVSQRQQIAITHRVRQALPLTLR